MSIFENVTVTKKANVYFDGKVTSRTLIFPDGTKKTLGIMLPGEYHFSTDAEEIMEILAGSLQVLLPGAAQWQTFRQGMTFTVPSGSAFDLKVTEVVDYCCSYLR